VYVVTESPPPEFAWVHDRFPRLLKMGVKHQSKNIDMFKKIGNFYFNMTAVTSIL
jgi:hypothetical protein